MLFCCKAQAVNVYILPPTALLMRFVLMRGPLKFDGSPTLMTAATLPMLVFCMNRMSIDERLGSFSFFLAVALVALGLVCGLSPAFFPRVDHPLHQLDRTRWRLWRHLPLHPGLLWAPMVLCMCSCDNVRKGI
ncbi:unnamed protein product [Durusdinium trenchii]|uniref:Mannosyltransferase n=1 Tax=Durusdinium trenchii TaxID=1381693 RepID=A0ABP0ME42_9DINO